MAFLFSIFLGESSGSVDRYTGEWKTASLGLTAGRVTVLFPWARHFIRCLVLVQPRKMQAFFWAFWEHDPTQELGIFLRAVLYKTDKKFAWYDQINIKNRLVFHFTHMHILKFRLQKYNMLSPVALSS